VLGLELGADDYLVKPFDPDEFRARIQVGRRVLGLQERVAELETALSKVKQLEGLLPIYTYCKRIRTDENYWQQVSCMSANIQTFASATASVRRATPRRQTLDEN
jgi:response regulator RpfG family c-di-GMP phosphodiesterase